MIFIPLILPSIMRSFVRPIRTIFHSDDDLQSISIDDFFGVPLFLHPISIVVWGQVSLNVWVSWNLTRANLLSVSLFKIWYELKIQVCASSYRHFLPDNRPKFLHKINRNSWNTLILNTIIIILLVFRRNQTKDETKVSTQIFIVNGNT